LAGRHDLRAAGADRMRTAEQYADRRMHVHRGLSASNAAAPSGATRKALRLPDRQGRSGRGHRLRFRPAAGSEGGDRPRPACGRAAAHPARNGYRYVLVNGEATIRDEKETQVYSGQLLRRGRGAA